MLKKQVDSKIYIWVNILKPNQKKFCFFIMHVILDFFLHRGLYKGPWMWDMSKCLLGVVEVGLCHFAGYTGGLLASSQYISFIRPLAFRRLIQQTLYVRIAREPSAEAWATLPCSSQQATSNMFCLHWQQLTSTQTQPVHSEAAICKMKLGTHVWNF